MGDGSKLTGITAPGGGLWSEITDASGNKRIQYKAGKNVTIGAPNSGASLYIVNKNQEAKDGDSLVLGKIDATSSNLRLGYHGNYTWIQSDNKPLAINPTGGNVGIGTKDPKSALDVVGYIVMQKPTTDAVSTLPTSGLAVQKPTTDAASALLASRPNSSLIIGGPAGESIAFYWKYETGKKHQASLKGTALT